MICDDCQALYEDVAEVAREAGVFGRVRRTDPALKCRAKHVDSETYYMVSVSDDHEVVYVGLHTPDRWLSESIEADLMHTGEKIEDLLEEELYDKGFEAKLPIEHFRDPKKIFVFRSPVFLNKGEKLNGEAMVERVAKTLLAYEATFRPLGKMEPKQV